MPSSGPVVMKACSDDGAEGAVGAYDVEAESFPRLHSALEVHRVQAELAQVRRGLSGSAADPTDAEDRAVRRERRRHRGNRGEGVEHRIGCVAGVVLVGFTDVEEERIIEVVDIANENRRQVFTHLARFLVVEADAFLTGTERLAEGTVFDFA